MTSLLAVLLIGGIVADQVAARPTRRVRRLLPAPARARGHHRSVHRPLAALAGVATAAAIGLPGGALVGTCLALGLWWGLPRLESSRDRSARERLLADLPLALDLVAGCLRGGSPLGAAVEVVAAATGGPLAAAWEPVVAAGRLGASPAQAWGRLAGDPVLGGMASAVVRTADSGAVLATVLVRLAAEQRTAVRSAAAERARRAGVSAVGPLGVCFLPAFVLLGIVPVVVGLIGDLVQSLAG